MIHYLDTSALVKRYVDEPGSALVRQTVRTKSVATARVAYAELAATLGRLAREGAVGAGDRDKIYARLDADFSTLTVVEVRVPLVRRVPDLVKRRPLRGYDAVHLAAALTLHDGGVAVTFWAADEILVEAARQEGLRTTLLR